jgi:hypothetical protein
VERIWEEVDGMDGAAVRSWLDVVRAHVHADLQVHIPKLDTPIAGCMHDLVFE